MRTSMRSGESKATVYGGRQPATTPRLSPGGEYNTFMKPMPMRKFAAIVRRVLETLPEEIKQFLENVVIDVEEQPSVEFLRKAGFSKEEIEAGATVYGYFMPFENLMASDMLENPDRILIFRDPLEEDFPNPGDLRIEIRKTVVHEIAHHFGWSDRDLERFDDNPDPFQD